MKTFKQFADNDNIPKPKEKDATVAIRRELMKAKAGSPQHILLKKKLKAIEGREDE